MKVDELRELIRELIKTELDETSTTGAGASITTGNSEAYATPYAFKKKKKK
jgi:hypothetical protein|tara:strand:- start:121 stop:273 length:153 start_codon:yes stop_codon:yes gene_type:complete